MKSQRDNSFLTKDVKLFGEPREKFLGSRGGGFLGINADDDDETESFLGQKITKPFLGMKMKRHHKTEHKYAAGPALSAAPAAAPSEAGPAVDEIKEEAQPPPQSPPQSPPRSPRRLPPDPVSAAKADAAKAAAAKAAAAREQTKN